MTFEPHPGEVIAQRYRLVEPLARGGMGAVWRAHHEQLDAPVAVKLMTTTVDPHLVARFEREAKACARMKSPHVVRVHDYGIHEHAPFMVMELLTGEDLAARLRRVGRMSIPEILPIAHQIAKGLTAAHDAGIVHRDLKPANVFITTDGREECVKLLDFGIARETEARLVDDRTTTGIVLGSPHHMSPEQAAGIDVDLRTDLWSFGVLLYQALTGERPFRGETLSAVVYAIATEKPTPPARLNPTLPQQVDVFFERALAQKRIERFTSADEMVRAFFESVGQSASSLDESSPSVQMARAIAARASLANPPSIPPPASPLPLVDVPSSPTLASQSFSVAPGADPFEADRRKRKRVMIFAAAAAAGLIALVAIVAGLSSSPASAPAASASVTPPPVPVAAATTTPTATAEPIASATATASGSTGAPAGRPAPASKPSQPAKAGTSCPGGKIRDSFTGLCVSPR